MNTLLFINNASMVKLANTLIYLCGFFLLFTHAWVSAEPADYYPFNAKFGEPLARYFTFPTCRYQDNQCRRWGIAAEVPVAHRGVGSIDSQYVDRLNAGGINFIRFNSIDAKRNNIFTSWLKGKLDASNQLLKPLDKLIPYLTERNIQYALSANDSPYKAGFSGAKKNSLDVKYRQYKTAQLTYIPAVTLSQKWLTWLYGRRVSGRPYIYGKDPGDRYVALVGEDSIYQGYFKYQRRALDDYSKDLLNKCVTGKPGSLPNKLPTKKELIHDPVKAKKVGSCLTQIESHYYQTLFNQDLKAVLPKNIAASNDWYGLGYLAHSNEVGNIIDAHAYFDHIVYFMETGKRLEAVRNRSLIAEPGMLLHGQRNLLRPNLLRLFASATNGKPMYVSEWNHSFWSDYAYEGPLLMTAYASFQDYPVLLMHTLMAWNDDKNKPISNHGFSVHGNQILQAMNPTLALAYRRGDIRSAGHYKLISAQGRSKTLDEEMFKVGVDPSFMSDNPASGLLHGVRMSFKPPASPVKATDAFKDKRFVTDTGEIIWDYSGANKASFIVDTPRFKAIAGELKQEKKTPHFKISANTHGALLMIALDNKPVVESQSILLTVISSQKNYEMITRPARKRWINYPLKLITSPGNEKVLLKRIVANLSLFGMQGEHYRVSAVYDQQHNELIGNIDNKNNELTLQIGGQDTPWYLLERVKQTGSASITS